MTTTQGTPEAPRPREPLELLEAALLEHMPEPGRVCFPLLEGEVVDLAADLAATPAGARLLALAEGMLAVDSLTELGAPDGFRRWVGIGFDGSAVSVGRWGVRTGITHLREGWPDEKRIGHGATLQEAVAAALETRP